MEDEDAAEGEIDEDVSSVKNQVVHAEIREVRVNGRIDGAKKGEEDGAIEEDMLCENHGEDGQVMETGEREVNQEAAFERCEDTGTGVTLWASEAHDDVEDGEISEDGEIDEEGEMDDEVLSSSTAWRAEDGVLDDEPSTREESTASPGGVKRRKKSRREERSASSATSIAQPVSFNANVRLCS